MDEEDVMDPSSVAGHPLPGVLQGADRPGDQAELAAEHLRELPEPVPAVEGAQHHASHQPQRDPERGQQDRDHLHLPTRRTTKRPMVGPLEVGRITRDG
jgi:hypothetical protein